MTKTPIEFRSKTEREREVDLQSNYRKIGIGAIAAASDAARRRDPKQKERPAKEDRKG